MSSVAPMAAKGQYIRDLEGERPTASSLTSGQKVVRQAFAPAVLGAAGGAMLGPGGLALGALGGELLNQGPLAQWSGAEPSKLNLVAAPALAAAAPMAGAALKAFPGAAPGLQLALQRQLGGPLTGLPAPGRMLATTMRLLGQKGNLVGEWILPHGTQSKALFQFVGQSGKQVFVNPKITRELLSTQGKVGQELELSVFGTGKTVANKLKTLVGELRQEGTGDLIAFQRWRVNQTELGQIVRQLGDQKKASTGRAKLMYRAMWDDLDRTVAAQPGPLGQQLQQALQSTKRESAAEFIKDYFMKATTFAGEAHPQVNLNSVLTKIQRDRDVLGRLLPEDDIDGMIGVLKGYARRGLARPIPSEMGMANIPFSARITSGVIGGAVGSAMGFPSLLGPAAGTFWPMGSGALVGIMSAEIISNILTSAPGRQLIAALGQFDMPIYAAANAVMQGGRAGMMQP